MGGQVRRSGLWTVVLSLAPRPRENERYEAERLRTNEVLFHEIMKLNKEGLNATLWIWTVG